MSKELSISTHCKKNTTPTMPWFSSVPTGNNTLSAKLKNMYHDAGINGNKVNHGLHTTGTTDMVQAHM